MGGQTDYFFHNMHGIEVAIPGYMSLISVSCWQHCASDAKYVATQDLQDVIVGIPALDHTNCEQRPISPCHAESLVILSKLRRKIVWLP